MNLPRAEHPNPQWERESWKNLNGAWEFEFDFGCSARERKLWEKEKFDREIVVPFCPESKLSGIAYTDFMDGVAYRRTFEITEQELSGHVLLHFGAVDYESFVYVNGALVGSHKGGYTSFSFDITKFVTAGSNSLFVAVEDHVRTVTACGMVREGDRVTFYVEGDGFLYNMVRIMVGTILEIAAGSKPQGCIPQILEQRDRAAAGFTAPAWGLYLDRVFYEQLPDDRMEG